MYIRETKIIDLVERLESVTEHVYMIIFIQQYRIVTSFKSTDGAICAGMIQPSGELAWIKTFNNIPSKTRAFY